MEYEGLCLGGYTECRGRIFFINEVLRGSVYCALRCPKCGFVQGARYPLKRSSCKRCARMINIQKTGVLGIFEDEGTFRSYIRDRKWEGDESEALELSFFIQKEEKKKEAAISKDRLRKIIIDILEDGTENLDGIMEKLSEREIDKDRIIDAIEDLIRAGEVYNPRADRYSLVG